MIQTECVRRFVFLIELIIVIIFAVMDKFVSQFALRMSLNSAAHTERKDYHDSKINTRETPAS